MRPAIRVDNLSKRYKLGLTHAGSIRELAARATSRLFRRQDDSLHHELAGRNGASRQDAHEPHIDAGKAPETSDVRNDGYFWALKDVSFDVQPGEVVGIIGRNGAGKSTLLKILSRITAPTSGRVEINGRVASLLEVGTGFHPELTGRENVYLNGAILGMTKSEVRRKFDEIVAFADIEQFIDTPVKRYSSGMHVRLAFAVAAHLEPEILVVDEVLAVGDAEFQKKSLGKMKDVAGSGRTVLFVSHNMEAVKQLCKKAIILNNGTVRYAGHKLDAVLDYQNSLHRCSPSILTGTKEVVLTGLRITNAHGQEIHTFNTFDSVTFELRYKSYAQLTNASFALCFDDLSGKRVTSLWSSFQNKHYTIDTNEFMCTYLIESIHLLPGVYSLVVYAESNGRVLERIDNYRYITVGYLDKYGIVKLPECLHGGYSESFHISIT
jgi:lipopolysaccharide transport system ATP-binding protein